uniref:ABC transporter substrate-binding protein n=1 Tax=Eubacterium cellulosolvens TaxID=29322 RepID=UPI00048588D3|nr:extracellular solute-binding protein [[Eubacterium] cellulosolvens]
MKKKVISALLCTVMVGGLVAGCGSSTSTSESKSDSAEKTASSADADSAEEVASTSTVVAPTVDGDYPTLNNGEPLELSIYTQYADDDSKVPYDYAVEALKEAFPNVTLKKIDQAQDDGATLKTLASTGQLPDIYQASTDIINTFRESNQIMRLNDVADSTGYTAKLRDVNKELAYDEEGNMYVFPFSGQEYVLWYYNKAIFEENGIEVPKTYDDLEKVIKALKEKDITPLALFAQEGWNATAAFDVVATRYNNGGVKDLDTGKAAIGDPEYVEAAKMLEKLVKDGLFQKDATTTNYDNANSMFKTGKAAMILNGQWYIEEATEALGDNVDWMYYPAKDEKAYEANKNAFSGGGSSSGFAVNPDGKNADDAAIVAEFIAEKYCEAKVLKRHNPLVAIDTGLQSESELPAMMQKLSDEIPNITSTTKFTWGLTNATFNDSIQANSQALISGEFSADDFISTIKDDTEE